MEVSNTGACKVRDPSPTLLYPRVQCPGIRSSDAKITPEKEQYTNTGDGLSIVLPNHSTTRVPKATMPGVADHVAFFQLALL